jgi:hypothetical protein
MPRSARRLTKGLAREGEPHPKRPVKHTPTTTYVIDHHVVFG